MFGWSCIAKISPISHLQFCLACRLIAGLYSIYHTTVYKDFRPQLSLDVSFCTLSINIRIAKALYYDISIIL